MTTRGMQENTGNQRKDDNTEERKDNTVYILITQCLQNGFFFADESPLCLDEDVVARMLIPSTISTAKNEDSDDPIKTQPRDYLGKDGNRRYVMDEDVMQQGPLYQYLSNLMDHRPEGMDALHVIHIRDWHKPSVDYDIERRLYGPHCEERTWEAQPLDGFDRYLQPWYKPPTSGDAQAQHQASESAIEYCLEQQRLPEFDGYVEQPSNPDTFIKELNGIQHVGIDDDGKDKVVRNVIHYPVLSDSVFDFRVSRTITQDLYGTEPLPIENDKSYLENLINGILHIERHQRVGEEDLHVNIAVIGVYTDIKIRTLLTGLQSRYRINNLIVSDVLTAAPSLERHLEALDFVHKVIRVEVVHSLNDLVSVLQPGAIRRIPQDLISDHIDFRDYRSYYLNKQNLLAYQDRKRIEYLELTRIRSKAVYDQISTTNRRLVKFGFRFLWLTVIFGILYLVSVVITLIDPSRVVRPELWLLGSVITGGLSLLQLTAVFVGNPLNRLQENLNQLIHLRSELETHSLILALLRYHFSTPERLTEDYPKDGDIETEKKKLEAIGLQIDMIRSVDFDAKAPDVEVQMSVLERLDKLRSSGEIAKSVNTSSSTSTTNAP